MTKPLCSELADIEWLTGAEAGAILAELAEDASPLHTTAALLRASYSAERTHLLLEQVDLRRRATAKFAHPERMFFTRVGLEQATDEWVAAYKAIRFLQPPVERASARTATTDQLAFSAAARVADLCCGIGGDLTALARRGAVVGVDRDPITAHLAAANAGTDVRAIDIVDFDLSGIDAWHMDPDRRPGGRRTTSLDWCEPSRTAIEQLMTRVPNAAIKLAPATDVPIEWAERCELEWISRDRECKQLVVWHGTLATTPGQRRATIVTRPASRGVPASEIKGLSQYHRGLAHFAESSEQDVPVPLSADDIGIGPEFRTIVGTANQPTPITSKVAEYIFDVDPAVTAARLTGTIAAELSLKALGGGPTYLTGSRQIHDAALACFQATDILPMRVSKLAQHLRAHNIGQLEIKKRGVEIDPEKLRRELKLRGVNEATLLIAKVAKRPVAIFAQRVAT